MTFTIFATAAAGGGGGGGGGGAVKNVSNWALGSSSVNASGIMSKAQMIRMFRVKDVVVAKNLRFRCTPNSSRLSENIARCGTGGPITNSLRGDTAGLVALAWASLTSGSWISIVLIGSLPASPAGTCTAVRRARGCGPHPAASPLCFKDIIGKSAVWANGPHHGCL